MPITKQRSTSEIAKEISDVRAQWLSSDDRTKDAEFVDRLTSLGRDHAEALKRECEATVTDSRRREKEATAAIERCQADVVRQTEIAAEAYQHWQASDKVLNGKRNALASAEEDLQILGRERNRIGQETRNAIDEALVAPDREELEISAAIAKLEPDTQGKFSLGGVPGSMRFRSNAGLTEISTISARSPESYKRVSAALRQMRDHRQIGNVTVETVG